MKFFSDKIVFSNRLENRFNLISKNFEIRKHELIEEIKRVDPARFIQVKLTNKGLDVTQRLYEIKGIIKSKDS